MKAAFFFSFFFSSAGLLFYILSSLPSFPDLPSLYYFLISSSFPIPLCQTTTSFLVSSFKDTGLLEWKAGLSLDIMANTGPVE